MPDNPRSTDSLQDPLANGLRAAFGDGHAHGSSVLRRLDVCGVHLHDADANDDAPVVIDEAAKALRDPSGRYQVLGEIGRGGVGIVYKGRDVDLGRDVAMKVLREEHASHPEILARFVEEAQIGGQLQHPGIVPVYELGLQHGERPYFAMKLIKGETLAALLAKRKTPDEDRRRFLGIFEQVCQTVAYAHARRVVHRDLKPANVMIGAFGEVQVVDWGLAKILPKGGVADEAESRDLPHSAVSVISTVRSRPGSGSDSVQGSMMGTPAYMPPEQALGDIAHVDRSSDVFALGAILCEILTGRPPYGSRDPLRQASRADLEPCYERLEHSGADAPLVALCKECLAPARQSRPASAQEVATRVGEYLSSVEERAREAQIRAAEARVRARATISLSAAAVLLLLVGGGGYLYVQQQAQTRRDRAEQRVAAAVNEANVRYGKASAAGITDLNLWELALDAGTHAEQLASDPDVSAEPRGTVTTLLATLRTDQQEAIAKADRIAKDEAMRLRLIEVRIPSDEITVTNPDRADQEARRMDRAEHEVRRMDQAYAAAFRDYLGDRELPDLTVEQAVARLRGNLAIDLAGALSHWVFVRGHESLAGPDNRQRTAHLQAVAAALDSGDPWRARLWSLLAEHEPQREEIEQLATDADLQHLPPIGFVLLGDALSRAGAGERAIAVFRQGCDLHPQDLSLCIRLAGMLEGAARYADSAAQYRTAMALRPSMHLVQLRLGYTLVAMREHAAAERVFRRLLQEDANLAPAHDGLGNALQSQGKFEAAFASTRHAIECDPNQPAYVCNLATILSDQGKLDEAVAMHHRAIALDPKNAGAHASLGNALQRQGKFYEAIASYRYSIELDPRLAVPHYNLGFTLYKQGKPVEAIASYRRAIQLDSRMAAAHFSLGCVLREQGKVDEAIASFRQAIDLDPKDAGAHCNLGSALFEHGEVEGAIASLRTALELDPHLVKALNNLGHVLERQGELDEAVAFLRRATELDPSFAAAHESLGIALYNQEKLDTAVASLSRAIEIDPNVAAFHENLGNALDAQGKVDDAIVEWRRAIGLDPRLTEPRNSLSSVFADRGELEEALRYLRETRSIVVERQDPTAAAMAGELAGQIADLESRLASRTELLQVAHGEREAASAEEWTGAAAAAYQVGEHAASARTYAYAFVAFPELLLTGPHRYNAACAAALAGCGKDLSTEKLTEDERVVLRANALAWLAAELERWRHDLPSGGDEAKRAKESLAHAQVDSDFDGVRSDAGLESLPAAEAESWRGLWRDIQKALEGKEPPR